MGAARTRGTLAYFKSNTWSNLQKRTVNGSTPHMSNVSYLRKGTELRMSKEEFYEFCNANQKTILGLYAEDETPSLDRIDDDGHYELSNLRVISFAQNREQSASKPENLLSRVAAATLAKLKRCLLIFPNGTEREYPSIKQAATENGLSRAKLSSVLTGKRKHHRGFRAKYK